MQTITIPKTAFRVNIRGYTRQPGKGLDACLWRELIQNSRDAGATRVDASLEETESHVVLTFRDDGKGMDWATLEKGMLTYAGSVKDAGAAGGFGMAKLVVCFSSDSTIIRTRDNAVRIEGIQYERLESTSYVNGCELVIACPKSEGPDTRLEPTEAGLRFLLERCDLGGMKVYFNGVRIPDCKLVKDDEFIAERFPSFQGTAYYYKRRKPFTDPDGDKVAVLTHRGIWVCDFPLPFEVKGAVLIDSDADPKKVLNDTRTSLSDYWQRRELEKWIGKINQGAQSTLKTKRFVKRFDGGLFVAEKAKAAETLAKQLMAETPGNENAVYAGKVTLTGEEFLRVAVAAAEKVNAEQGTEAVTQAVQRVSNFAGRLRDTGVAGSTEELAKQIRQLAWEPALMVVNEREKAVDRKFLPESMSPRAKQLLRVWTELVRQFLLWQGEHRPFGVGFVFSEDAVAQFKTEPDGTIWFLVNPSDEKGRITRRLSSKDHVRRLVMDAAHEAAHAAVDDGTIHGDRFVQFLELNLERVMKHAKVLDQVVKTARRS